MFGTPRGGKQSESNIRKRVLSKAVERANESRGAAGLGAFYISLLITFCGFLGAVIVNMSIDAVLGYATTEVGPIGRQRQPVATSRWQTLLAKWVMAVGLTVVLTGLMLFTAVVILKMNAPHFAALWLLSWFAAAVVAIGTLVLFAALGTLGQLVALVVFVYPHWPHPAAQSPWTCCQASSDSSPTSNRYARSSTESEQSSTCWLAAAPG